MRLPSPAEEFRKTGRSHQGSKLPPLHGDLPERMTQVCEALACDTFHTLYQLIDRDDPELIEAVLRFGLKTADASEIKWFLIVSVERLGLGMVCRIVAESLHDATSAVHGALYYIWLWGEDGSEDNLTVINALYDTAKASGLMEK